MSASEERSAGAEDEASGGSSGGDRAPEGQSGGMADWMSALRDVTPYLDLGWRLAGAAALPPLLGHLADILWDTTPWGLLAGAAVGGASVIVQLWRLQEDFDR